MSTTAYSLALTGAYMAALVFAAVIGGKPERQGAALLFAGCLITWALQGLGQTTALTLLTVDAVVAVALTFMVFRYRLTWIGAAACSQTLLLAFSASRMVRFPLSEQGYLIALSLSSAGVFASIAVGAWIKRWGPKDEYAEFLAEA